MKNAGATGWSAWLPVLCGQTVGSDEQSEAFLYDFRKTIAELIEQNYYKHFRELCRKANIEMHAEVIYGGAGYPPLDILKCNSYADMPMCEFWAGHNEKTSFPEYTAVEKPEAVFPAYACLWYDKPVLGAEAYTAQAHYSESLWDLKPFGDRAYCSGHQSVHSPQLRPSAVRQKARYDAFYVGLAFQPQQSLLAAYQRLVRLSREGSVCAAERNNSAAGIALHRRPASAGH